MRDWDKFNEEIKKMKEKGIPIRVAGFTAKSRDKPEYPELFEEITGFPADLYKEFKEMAHRDGKLMRKHLEYVDAMGKQYAKDITAHERRFRCT